MIKRTLTIGLAAVALGLAACGGSDDPAAAPAADAPAGGGTTVSMQDNSFAPGTIEVSTGETVTFKNEGAIAHTATGDDFDSGSVAPGESFSFTPTEAGALSYICTFHPGMQGTIDVS